MDVVVSGVAGNDEADVRDVQAGRLVGVGVAEFTATSFRAVSGTAGHPADTLRGYSMVSMSCWR